MAKESTQDGPEFIVIKGDGEAGDDELRLKKTVDERGVVYYSRKIDWRDPDSKE